jgi:O-antigen ligase
MAVSGTDIALRPQVNSLRAASRPPRVSTWLIFRVVATTLLIVACHLYSWVFYILRDKKAAVADFLAIALVGVWLAGVFVGRKPIRLPQPAILVLVWALMLWLGFEALRSAQPERGLTMYLLFLRNVAIFLLLAASAIKLSELRVLNRAVFLVGVLISLASVVYYAGYLPEYSFLIADPDEWYPTQAYVLDRGVMRMTGLVGDPNFFAYYLSLSFLCGVAIKAKRFRALHLLLLALIGSALLLTFSRGFLLAIMVSTMMIYAFTRLGGSADWKAYCRRLTLIFILLGGLGSAVALPFSKATPLQWLQMRLELMASGSRYEHRLVYWKAVAPAIYEGPVTGHGLRAGQEILHGTYVHNSYLDLLVDTGLIGLALYLGLVAIVGARAFRLASQDVQALPWLHGWLLALIFFANFSLLFNPFSWVVFGTLIGTHADPRGSPALAPPAPRRVATPTAQPVGAVALR